MNNKPEIKIGIVAVSRDCFPESLSVNRRKALVEAYKNKYDAADIYECPVCIVESEIHMQQALEDIRKAGCNALCVYLGNFGPEISETMLAKYFETRRKENNSLMFHSFRRVDEIVEYSSAKKFGELKNNLIIESFDALLDEIYDLGE